MTEPGARRQRVVTDIQRGEITDQPIAMPDPLPASSPRRLVLRVMWGTRRYSWPAMAGVVAHQIGEAMVPVIMGLAIDSAVVDGDLAQLLLWLTLLGVDFAVLSLSYRFGAWFGQLGSEAMQHQLRTTITDRLMHPRARADRLPGSALSLATNDVRRLGSAVALMVYPVAELAAVIVGGFLLLVQSVWLGLAVLIGAPVLLLLLDIAGRPLRRRARAEAEALADAAGTAADLLAGYRVLTGIGAQGEATSRYRALSGRALRATLRTRRTSAITERSLDLMTGLFVVGIGVAAGLLALDGQLSIGGLITVVGLTQFLLGPLTGFASNVPPVWAAAQASAARVLDLLADPTTMTSPEAADGSQFAPEVDLVVDDVELASGARVSFRARPGEIVGIRAPGTSATDLSEVLAARRAPLRGSVRVGGIAVDVEAPERTRAALVVAPHEAALFDGSIIENIAVPGHRPDLVESALWAAACADVLEVVPGGAAALVGEGGLRLSGGQRQRVALARALALGAPALVLHEPTSAVDSVTEAAIAARLREIRAAATTVLITTSPALLAAADVVIDVANVGGENPSGARENGGTS